MRSKTPFKLKQAVIRMVTGTALKSSEPITSPEAAIRAVGKELSDYDREAVCVINLTNSNQPINYSIVSVGSLDHAIVHPREMLKSTILSNAAKIIMVHNHPGGNLKPSAEDVRITDQMIKVCELMGIVLLDHIIVGPDNTKFYSIHDSIKFPSQSVVLATEENQLRWDVPFVAEGHNPYC